MELNSEIINNDSSEPLIKKKKRGRPRKFVGRKKRHKKPLSKTKITVKKVSTPFLIKERDTFSISDKKFDFLKLFKVVVEQAKFTSGLKNNDLYILFFLYSEGIFTKSDIRNYAMVMPVNSMKINRLIKSEFIYTWRQPNNNKVQLYSLTDKASKLVTKMYKQLLGLTPLSENNIINKWVQTNNSKMKMYQVGIRRINKQTIKNIKNRSFK